MNRRMDVLLYWTLIDMFAIVFAIMFCVFTSYSYFSPILSGIIALNFIAGLYMWRRMKGKDLPALR